MGYNAARAYMKRPFSGAPPRPIGKRSGALRSPAAEQTPQPSPAPISSALVGATDEELMARTGAGDAAAFRLLADRHLARVTAFAYRMLGNAAEAEDVAQDCFLRVWRHAPRWEAQARLTTWLHRVTYNLCLDRLRRRTMMPLEDVPQTVDPNDDPARRFERQEVAAVVWKAVQALPERQRAAITLVHLQELGNIEAAAAMQVSVRALESLLARGRRKLRELLAEIDRI